MQFDEDWIMYKLTLRGNSIVRIADNACSPMDGGNRDYQEYLEWVALGDTPMPAETTAEIKARRKQELIQVVQQHLDARARERGYDNIFTACTYANEPAVPSFQAEGQAYRI